MPWITEGDLSYRMLSRSECTDSMPPTKNFFDECANFTRNQFDVITRLAQEDPREWDNPMDSFVLFLSPNNCVNVLIFRATSSEPHLNQIPKLVGDLLNHLAPLAVVCADQSWHPLYIGIKTCITQWRFQIGEPTECYRMLMEQYTISGAVLRALLQPERSDSKTGGPFHDMLTSYFQNQKVPEHVGDSESVEEVNRKKLTASKSDPTIGVMEALTRLDVCMDDETKECENFLCNMSNAGTGSSAMGRLRARKLSVVARHLVAEPFVAKLRSDLRRCQDFWRGQLGQKLLSEPQEDDPLGALAQHLLIGFGQRQHRRVWRS